jgi:hypothetical protein
LLTEDVTVAAVEADGEEEKEPLNVAVALMLSRALEDKLAELDDEKETAIELDVEELRLGNGDKEADVLSDEEAQTVGDDVDVTERLALARALLLELTLPEGVRVDKGVSEDEVE